MPFSHNQLPSNNSCCLTNSHRLAASTGPAQLIYSVVTGSSGLVTAGCQLTSCPLVKNPLKPQTSRSTHEYNYITNSKHNSLHCRHQNHCQSNTTIDHTLPYSMAKLLVAKASLKWPTTCRRLLCLPPEPNASNRRSAK